MHEVIQIAIPIFQSIILKIILNILFYRLAINYRVCDGGGQEKLEDIHQMCTLQFNNILSVPTKEVLSKLIQKIFHITSFLRYKGISKYTAFKLVEKETPVEESVSLKIPEHCSTNPTCNSSNIQIVVQTEFCINGNSVQHCILFKENGNCTVKILNRDTKFMFPIKYNQNTIDGIIYVIETFGICKRVKQNVENPQEDNPNHEKWTSLINKTMNETRERSKVCNSIISMNFQLDICFACSSQVRLRRKRKLDNTLSDQKKNTSNKLVINKNILNVELKDKINHYKKR